VSYPDSVRYLYALGNELKVGAKFGLERMQKLLAALGNPESGRRFVHVAGTNGKGSTSAMVSTALRCSGLRTGLFTSPHLIEPTERIQINGDQISTEDFTAAFNSVHAVAERLVEEERIDEHPSYFETVTAMALIHFHKRCDISVIEVGLGGRLDATNVITPELTVITPIAFDHESFLGNTIESIAFEKAGILKPGVPLVMAPQPEPAEKVIRARAEELRCPITRVADSAFTVVEANGHGSRFLLADVEYHCPLPGRHQVTNAVTAVEASRLLGLNTDAVVQGLRQTIWPGRLEFVRHRPDFVLDGAHNPSGAEALASYIVEFCAGRPVWIVYGAMRDKAIEEVTTRLFPLANHLILTAPDLPRALRPEALASLIDHPHCTIAHTTSNAIEVAQTAPSDAVVFFTGSLYLVGEVRKILLVTVKKR
jgi:dihydrofolate synthase/folylpolyglutamate synthase